MLWQSAQARTRAAVFRINVTDTTWRLAVRHINEEIERIRTDLEKQSDEVVTASRRGQIKALRALLKDLPNRDFSPKAE